MTNPHTAAALRRRRAKRWLLVVVAVVLCAAAVTALLLARSITHRADPERPASASIPVSVPSSARPAGDAAAELATRPMVQLPAQAAQPQPLGPQNAGPPIALPGAEMTNGTWIPHTFPGTAEGALAQLVALDTAATAGADPEVYARGYREHSEPGAPSPTVTGLSTLMASMRARAGLPAAGPVDTMSTRYDITHGQLKGTAEDGRFVVACVLGQFSVQYQGRGISLGIGDCQALRFDGTRWRVASGALAAAAPCAWPGSADAVRAGYRELRT